MPLGAMEMGLIVWISAIEEIEKDVVWVGVGLNLALTEFSFVTFAPSLFVV
jgi:DNA-directed RNA polymerase subunit E'/Rpb7